MAEPVIAAVAAMARNRVIGAGNKLLWHIPEDFRHFKRVTMGKPVIMGRKTYESIGKPLPGRANIVISRDPGAVRGDVAAVATLDDALAHARAVAAANGADEICIIGGGQIYSAALPVTQRIYLTVIDRNYHGDAFFPELNMAEWTSEKIAAADEPLPYEIFILNRRAP
ncbi:MAG: dihydrofolate reductase [Micavibrio aeruginosavorus]|nr:dihydrofolate reductase [Micavibrio aeruginosavorus]